jgi:hypothetical protein
MGPNGGIVAMDSVCCLLQWGGGGAPVNNFTDHPWKPADLCLYAVPVFENYPQICARIYRPSFRENKPHTLILHDWKLAFWACFPENWVYKFGHWSHPKLAETSVSGYRLDWKRAFWACFRENDHFHFQNWVYKFGHWRKRSYSEMSIFSLFSSWKRPLYKFGHVHFKKKSIIIFKINSTGNTSQVLLHVAWRLKCVN